MIAPHPIEGIIRREIVALVIRSLEPAELVIAQLRALGCTDREIGEALDLHYSNVGRTMRRAQKRIAARFPCTAPYLEGRRPSNGARTWRPAVAAGLTAGQAARQLCTTPQTVRRWIREGRFPNARRDPDSGYWRVPAGDLQAFRRPKHGGAR
jgi:DNA-binding CsgD family transcriptional regulator